MKRRLAVGAFSAAMAASLLGASGAAAAVEFGDTCTSTTSAPGEYTLATLSGGGGVPLTAPSAGVITKVRATLSGALPFLVPTSVKTLRSTGGNSFTVTGQSTINIGNGTTVAEVRLPVQAGDRLGLKGESFTYEGTPLQLSVYCPGGSSVLGATKSGTAPGSTAEFAPATAGSIPLVAFIEPDADGDGYGDETQDKCPQSALVHTECPAVTVDTFSLIGKGSVRVLVATNNAAPVKVTGSAKLDKGGKVKIVAKAKTVLPGKLVSFTLKFPQKLKDALKELGPGEKLKLKIVASATNVAGQVSSDKVTAKLKGQG